MYSLFLSLSLVLLRRGWYMMASVAFVLKVRVELDATAILSSSPSEFDVTKNCPTFFAQVNALMDVRPPGHETVPLAALWTR